MSSAGVFLERSRYYLFTEYFTKLCRCADSLSHEALWERSDESSNSIGNLLMHLAGNVDEWIVGGVGGRPFERNRAGEFAAREGQPVEVLIRHLERVLSDSDAVLAGLSESDLTRRCTIQNRETTVLAAIYHVVEHFAMHTGQIVLLTKTHAPGMIRFYDDSDGAARPVWGGAEGSLI